MAMTAIQKGAISARYLVTKHMAAPQKPLSRLVMTVLALHTYLKPQKQLYRSVTSPSNMKRKRKVNTMRMIVRSAHPANCLILQMLVEVPYM